MKQSIQRAKSRRGFLSDPGINLRPADGALPDPANETRADAPKGRRFGTLESLTLKK